MPYTKGFDSFAERTNHFTRHGALLGIRSEIEYETAADEFLGGPKRWLTLECQRKKGDRIRYDLFRRRFGVISSTSHIRTFYRPERRITSKFLNVCYFIAECNKF